MSLIFIVIANIAVGLLLTMPQILVYMLGQFIVMLYFLINAHEVK